MISMCLVGFRPKHCREYPTRTLVDPAQKTRFVRCRIRRFDVTQ